MSELPLLDYSARMDMIEYYDAQMEAKCTNTLGGISTLEYKTDSVMVIKLTDVSHWELSLLPNNRLRCTHTISLNDLPEIEDRKTIHFYDTKWAPITK